MGGEEIVRCTPRQQAHPLSFLLGDCGGSTYSSFRIFFHLRMNRVSQTPAMLAAFLLLSLTLVNADVDTNLIFSKVSRKIDLSSQLAKVSTSITLENAGDKAIGFFYYAIEPSLVDKVAFVSAVVSLFLSKIAIARFLLSLS